MFPTIAGVEVEDYLRENVLNPLGMTHTTYYPFGSAWDDKLLPLRYGRDAAEGGAITWEVLKGQLDGLTLPRK